MGENGKAIAAVVALVIMAGGALLLPWGQILPQAAAAPNPAMTLARDEPTVMTKAAGVLEVVSVRGYSMGKGFRTVEGLVTNRGTVSLVGLRAVATLVDKDGKPISTDEGAVTFSPLESGQSSPFRIMVVDRPGMDGGWVQFRDQSRAMVPTTDNDGSRSVFIFE